MIKVKNLKIPNDYVLVKVEKNLETFQFSGKETNILTTNYIKSESGHDVKVEERHFSVMGKVFAVPQKLSFNLFEINAIRNSRTTIRVVDGVPKIVCKSSMQMIDDLTKTSQRFNTKMNVEVGDIVYFDYSAHKIAKKENLYIDTDEGYMAFIKYDNLYMTLKDKTPHKMLNGYILVEPKTIDTVSKNGLDYIEMNGIIIPISEKNKYFKIKNTQLGKIVNFGERNKGYLELNDGYDCHTPLEVDMQVVYDARCAIDVEYQTHQILFNKKMHFIQRKDFILIGDKDYEFK